jgi:hypothetical protein
MATGIPQALRYAGVYGLMEVGTSQLPQDEATKASSFFFAALPWVVANSMMASPHTRFRTLAIDMASSALTAITYFQLKRWVDDRESTYRMGRVTNGAVIGGGTAAVEQALINSSQLLHGEANMYRTKNALAYFYGFVAGSAVNLIKEYGFNPVKSKST